MTGKMPESTDMMLLVTPEMEMLHALLGSVEVKNYSGKSLH